MTAEIRDLLNTLPPLLRWEASCEVPDDPGEVVRGAMPPDDRARAMLREQHIARLRGQP